MKQALKEIEEEEDHKKFKVDKDEIQKAILKEKCLIDMEGEFKAVWDYIQLVFILYISITAPFKVAFLEDYEYVGWDLFDHGVDVILGLDMIINFFTPYYLKHSLETSHWKIAKRYLKLWFWLDLISIIPFQLIIPNEAS